MDLAQPKCAVTLVDGQAATRLPADYSCVLYHLVV